MFKFLRGFVLALLIMCIVVRIIIIFESVDNLKFPFPITSTITCLYLASLLIRRKIVWFIGLFANVLYCFLIFYSFDYPILWFGSYTNILYRFMLGTIVSPFKGIILHLPLVLTPLLIISYFTKGAKAFYKFERNSKEVTTS